MMIPLRRALIVKEHDTLIYPEGTACAEVLIAGEERGLQAKRVFQAFGVGFVYKFLMGGLKLWPDVPGKALAFRSEEHTSELQSQSNLVCRLLLEKKKHHQTQPVVARRPDVHSHLVLSPQRGDHSQGDTAPGTPIRCRPVASLAPRIPCADAVEVG